MWGFPNLVVSNLVVCNFYTETLFCAHLCERSHLERPRLEEIQSDYTCTGGFPAKASAPSGKEMAPAKLALKLEALLVEDPPYGQSTPFFPIRVDKKRGCHPLDHHPTQPPLPQPFNLPIRYFMCFGGFRVLFLCSVLGKLAKRQNLVNLGGWGWPF